MNNEIIYVKLTEILHQLDNGDNEGATSKLRELVAFNEPVVSSPVTVEQAKTILKSMNNGVIDGISPGKNGRAWLSGEFELCYLEAICTLVRAEAGDNAQGAKELFSYWEAEGML